MQTAASPHIRIQGSFTFGLNGFSFSAPSTRLTRSFSFGICAWGHRGPAASFYVFDDRMDFRPNVYARFWLLFPNESRRRTWAIRLGQEG